MKTHYEVLGVSPRASKGEIKSAYRKLARVFHPDINQAPDSADRFREIARAYEILSDSHARLNYDSAIGIPPAKAEDKTQKIRREEQELKRRADEQMQQAPRPQNLDAESESRLTTLMVSGKVLEAERLAQSLLAQKPRSALPHAVLGDIAKMRGQFDLALQFYSLAAQYSPANTAYQKQYELLLNSDPEPFLVKKSAADSTDIKPFLVAASVSILTITYTLLSKENSLGLPMARNLTFGGVSMLLIAGIVFGASSSLSKSLPNPQAMAPSATSKFNRNQILLALAMLNFWLGLLTYLAMGLSQQTLNRHITLVAMIVGILASAFGVFGLSRGASFAFDYLCWGASIIFIGFLTGWLVTDALSRASSS